jgi:PKD repeat protein
VLRALAALALLTLILTTLAGCEASTPQPTPTPSPYPCSADFTAEPKTGVGTTTIQFTDKSTGEITSWAWDFENDGIVDSTEQNPDHTYRTNGNYTISLTITTADCQDTEIKQEYISITGCKT